jgi:hypothetical protein
LIEEWTSNHDTYKVMPILHEAGKCLSVYLTNGQITDEKYDEKTARKYIGGTGIGAKYLFTEVPNGVVENMSYLYVPEIDKRIELFSKSRGEEMA